MHISQEKKKNLPCLKRKDIFSFVLVRKQKMELTVTSGFINNPPVSHVCKPRDKKLPSWHKLRNTAHVCDQNGHSRWTPAPFMAFIDVKEQFKKKHGVLFTDKAAQYAKSRVDKKNLGFF